MHRHHADDGCSSSRWTLPPLSRFQGGQAHRYGLHQSFPLASPTRHSSPSSGPDRHAHTEPFSEDQGRSGCAPVRDPANQLPCALRGLLTH
ncbi:unnamed protein product [Brassica napus]|uniref:(rape) hypothetical protein n=1 Tax=Brassica napus TaxID=3708 RepID=A0A816T0A2_BRANA|nr:unnamed protein product [Brassica napus]